MSFRRERAFVWADERMWATLEVGYGASVIDLPSQNVPSTSSDPWWKLRGAWIYDAIVTGELRDHDAKDDVRYDVWCESLGELPLPGGQLVAADPYVMEAEPKPFVQRLGVDVAEVVAARAIVGEAHERVAALVLLIGSNSISDWKMATVAGQDVSGLDDEGFFGYGVVASTGSFGSPGAMRVAGRVLAADSGMLDDPLSTALFSDGIGTRSAVVMPPEAGESSVAVCASGWGDGVYPTWLGVDKSGEVMVAVTDFLLTGDPYAAPKADGRQREETSKARPQSLLRRWFGGPKPRP